MWSVIQFAFLYCYKEITLMKVSKHFETKKFLSIVGKNLQPCCHQQKGISKKP